MKITRISVLGLTILLAAQTAFCELSVRMKLPVQLSGEAVPYFAVRDKDGENPFQKRQLEKMAASPEVRRVALVFFATWCMPCAKGATIIRRSRADLKRNGILAVFVNVGERDYESVNKWLKQYGDPEQPLIIDNRSQMSASFGLLESDGSIIMPKILVLDKKLKPLFLLGTEGVDFPEVLWKYNP